MLRMLDLFCGRLGWSKAFLARGWECWGVDLVEPPDMPPNFHFVKGDVTDIFIDPLCDIALDFEREFVIRPPDFICASPPCQEFSVHGMKHFHPNPPYPHAGINLFEFTRELCEGIGKPYVIENVRAAQQFVGQAVHHCGPFYLWGSGVPPLLSQGIKKAVHALQMAGGSLSGPAFNRLPAEDKRAYRNKSPWHNANSKSPQRQAFTAQISTIPPELANCVASYAENLLTMSKPSILGKGPIPSGQRSERWIVENKG